MRIRRILPLDNAQSMVVATAAASAIFFVSFCLYPLISAVYVYDKNYNEGWNAYHQLTAAHFGNIYAASSPYVFTNYTPVSFYLVGLMARNSDYIMTGRMLSIFSFLSIIITVGYIARRLGASLAEALFGSSLCIGILGAYHAADIGIDDPQLLGSAIDLLAMAMYVTWRPIVGARILILGCLAIAGLVKQATLAVPIAIAADLIVSERRRGILFLAEGVALLILSVVALICLFGSPAITQIVAPREYNLHRAATKTISYLSGGNVLLPIEVLFLIIYRGSRANRFMLIYLSSCFSIGALLIGGAGTESNMFVDLAISSSIAAPVILRTMREELHLTGPIIASFFMLCIYGPALRIPYAFEQLRDGLAGSLNAKARIFHQDLRFMALHPGDAICDSPALCFRARRKFMLDAFNASQAIRLGRRDPGWLFQRIESREFVIIQLSTLELSDPDGEFSFGKHLEQKFRLLLNSNYQMVRNSGRRVFYVPR
jgi:hypothetical protein